MVKGPTPERLSLLVWRFSVVEHSRRYPIEKMITRISLLAAALASSVCSVGQAFVTPGTPARALRTHHDATQQQRRHLSGGVFTHAATRCHAGPVPRAAPRRVRFEQRMSQSVDIADLCLTPQLERMTKAFKAAPNDKLRHVQLLEMAGMAPPIDPALKTEENEVPG